MAETGFAYVPTTCSGGVHCRVHVALHGCLQNAETIQQDYILHAGYNKWADTNAIIVLYPQTTATNKPPMFDPTAPLNPNGCWEWFGFTDSNYATNYGLADRRDQGVA
jgi:poly(3-hydroxybutyrate) depolymerase